MVVGATCIRVLGPFELLHDSRVVPVGGPVGQAIVTALASRPDTKVLPTQLRRLVWGDPDAISVNTLYRHVTRLRRLLVPVGLDIVGHRPGYRLPISAEHVDVARFDELLGGARALSATDPAQAAERLRAALSLWRGSTAVDNLTLPGIRRLAAGWEARRWDAEEDLAEIDLARGRPEQVLDRLHTLAAMCPDRPRLAAVLARALHATGRTDRARAVLAEVDNATDRTNGASHPALAHARVALSTPARHSTPQDPTVSAASVVPFQLPADTIHFTGRTEHLDCLLDLRPEPGKSGGPVTVVVTAVEGMAGIGKTALAVHAAHRLADRFPDGVLFTDLHGFTPDTEPTAPEQALDRLLRGLGVPGPQIPPDLETRVGLYRSVLAGRRVLIVLDNAIDETQLIPLLPATSCCRAIVTSRRHLAGLDDAAHLTLPALDPAEATELLRGLAGDRTAPTDRPTIERIVQLCGRLPLAIRITAARLRLAPAATPTKLCAELEYAQETGRGLDWLSDGHRTITAALAMSYQHLTPDQRYALRLAGLHPGPDLEPYALAALAGTTIDRARQLLEDLHAASLLDQPTHRRYALHDLVAAYTRRLAADLPEADQRAALDRLYDHYAATGTLAMNLTYPWEADHRPTPPASHTPTPELADRDQAQSWLDVETDNLLSTAHRAATGQRGDHLLHQSATLRRYLRARGHYSRAVLLYQRELDSARRTGNRGAEQNALIGLGQVHHLQGRYGSALGCLEQALEQAHQTGNHIGELDALIGLGDAHRSQANYSKAALRYQQALERTHQSGDHGAEQEALIGLGHVHRAQGQWGPALGYFEQALASARRTGNHGSEENALIGLGIIHYGQGRNASALDCFEQALASARRTGNYGTERDALNGLGLTYYLQGRHGPALDCFEQALASARQAGSRHAEYNALRGLGAIHLLRGRYGPAGECFEQVLVIARQADDGNGQFEAYQGLGRVHHATTQHQNALRHHQAALRLAIDLNQPTDQARAHDGMAQAHRALGDTDLARHHWQAALDVLTRIGTDNTEDADVTTTAIRTHLHDLDNPTNTPGPRPDTYRAEAGASEPS